MITAGHIEGQAPERVLMDKIEKGGMQEGRVVFDHTLSADEIDVAEQA